jgi:TnpA family transposase
MPARVPMTERQREALLPLPDTEDEVIRHHSLDADDLAAIAEARTPETRLSYALQLCCLRYPGRNLRRGEVLPAVMLDHIAEQIGVDAAAIAGFARRGPTRYEQLAAIKRRHGFRDLTQPGRVEISAWLVTEAVGLNDGRVLLDRLILKLRADRIAIPGASVVERMAAEAMHAADLKVIAQVDALLDRPQRDSLDAILSDKAHARQSRLAWLREPPSRVGGRSLFEILDKIELIRATGVPGLQLPAAFHPRLGQMAREGVRYTAQAFQQMGRARRYAGLVATLRELEATLTDAALAMFRSLVARANLRARKRLEDTIAASAESGRERLLRIAEVLEALTKAARSGRDIAAAVTAIATLDVIEADAALIRRMTRPGRPDALGELGPEYKVFKQVGSRFLASFAFEGRASTAPLRAACEALVTLGGDWRKALPANLPFGHIERRWRPHVVGPDGIDRTYWELATYFGLSDALASGDIWVPTSRLHRSLDVLLVPAVGGPADAPARLPTVPGMTADAWIGMASAQLDAALLGLSRGLSSKDARLFAGDKLRFPKETSADLTSGGAKQLALRSYGFLPPTRITDVLSQVNHWTGFVGHFGHVSSGLPPDDERAFLAALIAEATNLGLSRMAEVCGAGSRRALLRMQTWHMREETFRAALGCLTDAIHAEPLSAWFGDGFRASADGQAFNLGGPGAAGGQVNAHYGRDPIVKIYTTITDRYAPLHQTVIAGTAGEAVHALDGILGHDSGVDVSALHVDGGGVSDIVFAVMHLLGLDFEPRIPRLSDRRLYAFQPRARYGRLAPLFGQRLDGDLIHAHWDDIGRVISAMRARTVTPSLILKKLSAYKQQNGLAAALREVGRVQRTLFTVRWFDDPALRRLVTAELNKGEARNSLARAVAFHRLGRFRDRGHENQQTRAAGLNLVTAAIILFNCRYLGRALGEMRSRGMLIDETLIPQLSPLGWDHINLTGDYIWSDTLVLDADGCMPLRLPAR